MVVQEEFALIFAVLKWTTLAILSGVIVGGGVTIFVELLEYSIKAASGLSHFWTYAGLPLGLTASALSVRYLAPDASGHGTEKVVEAVHERAGDIELKVVPVKMLSTVFTVALGGSAGKEGPATQIAAGLTSTLARWLKFNDYDKKKLVVCGVSAGFAAVFGTPVAGAVFALEVLYIGKIFYDVLFPSFISGVVAWRTALWLGLRYGSFPIDAAAIPYTLSNFGWAMLAGCFFGLVALCFVELMNFCDNFFNRLRWPLVAKALLGAALIALLTWQVGPEYLGLSDGAMAEILRGRGVPFFAWLWKTAATVLTLACGGSGGVVTPIFYIGAAAGSAFAALCGLNSAVYASWGMVGVLAGCANAPLSSTIMAVELFGSAAIPFAAVLCVTSFIIVGHRSVYPSQLLERTKSSLLVFPQPGRRIDQVQIQVDLFRSPLLHHLHLRRKKKQQKV